MRLIHQECIILIDRIGQIQSEIEEMKRYQYEWGSFWEFPKAEAEKEITQKENELQEYITRYNLLLQKLTKK